MWRGRVRMWIGEVERIRDGLRGARQERMEAMEVDEDFVSKQFHAYAH